jgi:hypothetical protein
MGPGEIEELLSFEPFIPLRLTLASGDVIELRRNERIGVTGLSLSIADTNAFGQARLRLISMPNIVLIEPIAPNERGTQRNEATGL